MNLDRFDRTGNMSAGENYVQKDWKIALSKSYALKF